MVEAMEIVKIAMAKSGVIGEYLTTQILCATAWLSVTLISLIYLLE